MQCNVCQGTGGVAEFWFAVVSWTENRLGGNIATTNGGGVYATGESVASFEKSNFIYKNQSRGNLIDGQNGCDGGFTRRATARSLLHPDRTNC
jgi:predicted outer membrane repeat protein